MGVSEVECHKPRLADLLVQPQCTQRVELSTDQRCTVMTALVISL